MVRFAMYPVNFDIHDVLMVRLPPTSRARISTQLSHKLNGGESLKLHPREFKWTLVALYKILPLTRE